MKTFPLLVGAILLAGTVLTVALLINVGQPLLLKSMTYFGEPTITTPPMPTTGSPSPSATLSPTASPAVQWCKCDCITKDATKLCRWPGQVGAQCTKKLFWSLPSAAPGGKCANLVPAACQGYQGINQDPTSGSYNNCFLRKPEKPVCLATCFKPNLTGGELLCPQKWVDGKCPGGVDYRLPYDNNNCDDITTKHTCSGYDTINDKHNGVLFNGERQVDADGITP